MTKQEYSPDGKSIKMTGSDTIVGLTEAKMPAPGEPGLIKIKLRVPTMSDEGSMIALCSLPQNGDDVVLDEFFGVFSPPKMAIINAMSAEMHLRMKVAQKFDGFLGQVMGALHFKKLKAQRDNFDDEAKMLY